MLSCFLFPSFSFLFQVFLLFSNWDRFFFAGSMDWDSSWNEMKSNQCGVVARDSTHVPFQSPRASATLPRIQSSVLNSPCCAIDPLWIERLWCTVARARQSWKQASYTSAWDSPIWNESDQAVDWRWARSDALRLRRCQQAGCLLIEPKTRRVFPASSTSCSLWHNRYCEWRTGEGNWRVSRTRWTSRSWPRRVPASETEKVRTTSGMVIDDWEGMSTTTKVFGRSGGERPQRYELVSCRDATFLVTGHLAFLQRCDHAGPCRFSRRNRSAATPRASVRQNGNFEQKVTKVLPLGCARQSRRQPVHPRPWECLLADTVGEQLSRTGNVNSRRQERSSLEKICTCWKRASRQYTLRFCQHQLRPNATKPALVVKDIQKVETCCQRNWNRNGTARKQNNRETRLFSRLEGEFFDGVVNVFAGKMSSTRLCSRCSTSLGTCCNQAQWPGCVLVVNATASHSMTFFVGDWRRHTTDS